MTLETTTVLATNGPLHDTILETCASATEHVAYSCAGEFSGSWAWRDSCTPTTRARAWPRNARRVMRCSDRDQAGRDRPTPTSRPMLNQPSKPTSAYAPPHCEAELVVAQRALEARREGTSARPSAAHAGNRVAGTAASSAATRKGRDALVPLEGDEPIPEALAHRSHQRLRAFQPGAMKRCDPRRVSA